MYNIYTQLPPVCLKQCRVAEFFNRRKNHLKYCLPFYFCVFIFVLPHHERNVYIFQQNSTTFNVESTNCGARLARITLLKNPPLILYIFLIILSDTRFFFLFLPVFCIAFVRMSFTFWDTLYTQSKVYCNEKRLDAMSR